MNDKQIITLFEAGWRKKVIAWYLDVSLNHVRYVLYKYTLSNGPKYNNGAKKIELNYERKLT